jgi:hypothetical protein
MQSLALLALLALWPSVTVLAAEDPTGKLEGVVDLSKRQVFGGVLTLFARQS